MDELIALIKSDSFAMTVQSLKQYREALLGVAETQKNNTVPVDDLAQFIRQIDGDNVMGAGALAENIVERFGQTLYAPKTRGEGVADYKVVPVELLKDWHDRINTIAAEMAFNVADEMESMLAAAPDVVRHMEALQAENIRLDKECQALSDQLGYCDRERLSLQAARNGHRAARLIYASEFPMNEDGDPDVRNIHANIRALKAECNALRVAAKYSEEVDATPDNQRETILYDTLRERDELKGECEKLRKDVLGLVEALGQIERWDGFPSTDKVWEGSGEPVSYGAAFGSNGERDFMREVARKALAANTTAHSKGGIE